MNYNITLLKTIKDPLFQAFEGLREEIDAVISSQKPTADLSTRDITNIIGSLQMIGRPSLVLVATSIRTAMERVQSSEKRGWDLIKVASVLKNASQVSDHLFAHVKALEKGERDYVIDVWPLWQRLEQSLDQPSRSIDLLFDPDPTVAADQFAPLEPATLREISVPHLLKFDTELEKMLASAPGDNWDSSLRKILEVFDWAFALKHRMGFHAYWLACRARITLEMLSQSTDRDALLQALKSAKTELNKFSEDSRKPRPESVQQMMFPLLGKWPQEWNENHHVLQSLVEVFNLNEYWEVRERVLSTPENTPTSLVGDSADLLDAIRNMKAAWLNLAGSENGDVRPFLRSLMTFLPKYELFPNPGSQSLLEALKLVAHRFVNAKRNDIPADFAQEVATALLLIEDTIEKKGRWSPELERQAEIVYKRVQAACYDQHEQLSSLPTVIWGGDRRRQQSQEAVSKVVGEVLSDLRFVENIFDEYFRRDAVEAKEHAEEVKNKIATSRAILQALGQNNAASVMDVVQKCAGVLRRDGAPSEYKREYEMLTIALTGLTSFLNSFEKGDPDSLRLLEPALAHLGLGAQGSDKRWDQFNGDLMGQAVERHHEAASERPSTPDSDDEQERLEDMQRRAQSAFDALEGWTDTTEDPELADAFFEEAAQLLNNISDLRKVLQVAPDKTDSLTDLRRQFHTFKGSGRTTQFWGVGELARRVEVRFNDALQRSEIYTSALDRLTEFAFDTLEHALNELNSYQTTTLSGDLIEHLLTLVNDQSRVSVQEEQKALSQQAEQDRLAEEARLAEQAEQERLAEEARLAEQVEQARLAEEARLAEQDRLAEEAQLAEQAEQERLAEEAQLAEQAEQDRLAEEALLAEQAEQERLAEESRLIEMGDQTHADDHIRLDVQDASLQQAEVLHAEEQIADISSDDFEDDLSDVISDLETHRDNLLELSRSDRVDSHLLHWSAHTLASLARGLEQERYRSFCKTLELKIEDSMGDDTVPLTDAVNRTLKGFVAILLEKTEQLVLSPRTQLQWDMLDEQAEQELADFEYSPSALGKNMSDEGIGERTESDVLLIESPSAIDSNDWEAINTHMSIIMVQMEALQKLFIKLGQGK